MGKGKRRAKESPKDSFYAVLDVETPESDHVDAGVLASVLSVRAHHLPSTSSTLAPD